jgi:hypothetical protein
MWSSPYFSHIPSQPIRISYSLPLRSTSMISGIQVIGCLLKGNPSTCLCPKSPIDRVRFSPLTLPWMIGTPVLLILSFSVGFYGLWSKDRAIQFSPCHRAALESPAFAQIILYFVIATTTAVAPAFSYSGVAFLFNYYYLYLRSYYIPGLNFIISSTWMNVYVSACPILPSAKVFLLRKI